MFLAGITLGACTDDYTDWANPQSNSPEDAAAKYEINYAAGTDAAIVMDDVYAKYADDAEGLKSRFGCDCFIVKQQCEYSFHCLQKRKCEWRRH